MADRPKIGEILVRRGTLTGAQVDEVLKAQGTTLQPFASTALKMGFAAEADLAAALAEQFGVPGVVLSGCTLPTTVLGAIPAEIAASHRILPIASPGSVLNVAVANPKNQALLDEVSFASGRATLPFVAIRGALDETIREVYAARTRGEGLWMGVRAKGAAVHLELAQPSTRSTPSRELEPETSEARLENFPKAPAEPAPRVAGSKPRVLAVDDEVEILDIIDKALTHRGFDVIRAVRGRQALDLLRSEAPDIVLLDAMLPEIHGFEICSQIKSSQQFQHIPVIIISAIYTGWNFIQDVKRIYGANDYMTKPFRVMELVHKVEETLAKSKGQPPSPEQTQAHKRAAHELHQAADALRRGQVDECIDAAQRAVRVDPFDPRAHFVLGTALHRANRFYEAISEYERVVELAPSQFNALKNLAALYERQGFKAKAVEIWMRAMEQSPNDAVRQTIKAHLIGLL